MDDFSASAIGWQHPIYGDDELTAVKSYVTAARVWISRKSAKTKQPPSYRNQKEFRVALEDRRQTIIDKMKKISETVISANGQEYHVEFFSGVEDGTDYKKELEQLPGFLEQGEEPLSQRSARELKTA